MGDQEPEMVDLTGEASSTPPKVTSKPSKEPSTSSCKKLKQLRLPFAPINAVCINGMDRFSSCTYKNNHIQGSSGSGSTSETSPASATSKRKRSDSSKSAETPSKVVVKEDSDGTQAAKDCAKYV